MNKQFDADSTNRVDIPSIQPQESHFESILDKCWADPITALGVAAAGVASYMIIKKHYGIGAVFAAASGIADYFDGKEARRFAKRCPEAAAERQDDGEFHDQTGDRFRNALIAGAIALSPEVPPLARRVSGIIAVAETSKILGGGVMIGNHRRKGNVGIPELPPSAPIGKESMWWIGAGLVSATTGAALRKRNHSAARKFEIGGVGLLAGGIFRMGQATLEYARYMKQVSIADKEGREKPLPNYKPHLGQKLGRLISRQKAA